MGSISYSHGGSIFILFNPHHSPSVLLAPFTDEETEAMRGKVTQ